MPKSLVDGNFVWSPWPATAVTSQSTKTPDWPVQTTTKPQAPHARPQTGTRHTQAKWLSGKKYTYMYIHVYSKKRGEREGSPRTAKL